MEDTGALNISTRIRVEKYADGVTREEIESGEAEPYEVIEIDGEEESDAAH